MSAGDTEPEAGTVQVTLRPGTAQALSAAGPPRAERLIHTLDQSLRFYLDGDRQTPGWSYPHFLGIEGSPAEDGVRVQLPRELWERLLVEADRQEVGADDLLQHAALYFAAARDAGRLTSRILAALDAAESGELPGDDRGGA